MDLQKRINELKTLKNHPNSEGVMTMLASEEVLRKDWENQLDERWDS